MSRPVREGGAVAGSVGASLKRYRRLSSHSSPNGFPSGPQPAILLPLLTASIPCLLVGHPRSQRKSWPRSSRWLISASPIPSWRPGWECLAAHGTDG